MYVRLLKCASALALAVCGTALAAKPKPHVLVISIDGMRADYVTQADAHHLKIPALRRFLKDGVYADGVTGVVPTLTYPSHTTLMTGVWPDEHGVYNNQKFDPLGTMHGAVFTDAKMIRVKTLWQAAHDAGYTTASVGWPITTGAEYIDWLMPANATFEGKAADGEKPEPVPAGVHFDHPAGLREVLAPDVPKGDLSIDEQRFAWTQAILRRYRPGFMTTHLGELDHAEHGHGPFSEEADAALEMLDGEVAKLVEIERAIDPNATIVVVSDHGFLPTEKTLNLNVLFVRAGLMPTNGGAEWQAAPWVSGGTAAIMLRDPADKALAAKVRALLADAAAKPEYGIARVLEHAELEKRGGFGDATFLVETKPGFRFGQARTGDVVAAAPHTGAHGFMPDRPELRASFLMMGPGVAHGRDVGVIDMRQIAPTLAEVLGLKLSAAKMAAVRYHTCDRPAHAPCT